MISVIAGRAPHTITRPCRDLKEACRIALEMAARGYDPIALNGIRFDPDAADSEEGPPLRPH